VSISQSPDRFAVWLKMSLRSLWFLDSEVIDLLQHGYYPGLRLIISNTVYNIQDLQRQILDLQRGPGSLPRRLGRGHGDQLLVLHPCNYCRYGLHRAGPIAPMHPLQHVWDRSRPWLVTLQQHLRMLRESMLAGNAWWRQGLSNYYCVACHTWWKNVWSEVWDHLILFCISIAHHEQPLHSEYRQHWSYILIL